MNQNYNYFNNSQSYYQQSMNGMYQGQNGNFNQQMNNGQMMNYNQNTPYMNQMNCSNNSMYNQNLMNNNRSRSHNAYFVSRFGQNNFNNNMFNNPTYFNNNMNNNLNNMNNYTNNNISRYNNIGTINYSNNYNNMNNNNIASINNANFNNNLNNYNNYQNINSMNNLNNITMNNNNTFNNMNNINNNISYMNSNTNNFNNNNNQINTNNTGKNINNFNNMFNSHTVVPQNNKNNKKEYNIKRNHNKRELNPKKVQQVNNISTYKEESKENQKNTVEQNNSNNIKKETNRNYIKRNIGDNNLKNEIPNYNEQLRQKDKNDINKESLKNNSIEEKPSEEDDLKLNGLIKARGLQNVGATCYMNATLQCLYHVKQLSEALVNDNNINGTLELTYSFKKLIEELAFTNIKKFKIDRQFNLVTGEKINFIKPENFKEVLSKKNPLFKGIKANDSKDLIMYLLEQMDKELTLRNNNSEKMEMFVGTDESELEKEKFKEFHNSIFCDLFYGFQRSDMICNSCRNTNSTYNVFNNLILPIEKTYNSLNNENKNKHKNANNNIVNMFNPQTNYTFNRRTGYNLGYNFGNNFNNFNNNTPDLPKILNVQDCIKECFKDEILSGDNQIYCNKCKKMSNSTNRTTIYKAPNVLILILNRGRGNSFECEIKFSSKEILDLSLYNNIIRQDSPKQYNLFGVISHIGESSDEGHFIAYCKHFDNNWYMFNDSIAKTVGENELTNGVPYILFYRNINLDKEFGN